MDYLFNRAVFSGICMRYQSESHSLNSSHKEQISRGESKIINRIGKQKFNSKEMIEWRRDEKTACKKKRAKEISLASEISLTDFYIYGIYRE